MRRIPLLVLACTLIQGCAMKGDIRRIEDELRSYNERLSMADSARAATLALLVDQAAQSHAETQRLLDSVTSEVRRLTSTLGDLRGELTDVQRELQIVQELAGQSQASLRELRTAIEAARAYATTPTGDPDQSPAAGPDPGELYRQAVALLNRGSTVTAREGLLEFLRWYPADPRVADALFWIGESYHPDTPDSAQVYFGRVVDEFPEAARAGSALYKMGLAAENLGNESRAFTLFERVIVEYNLSDAAALACDKFRQADRPIPEGCR